MTARAAAGDAVAGRSWSPKARAGCWRTTILILNLNDPCAIADTSWIKPGKVIREVTLTTAGGKACVDFAVQRTACSTSSSTPAGTATNTTTPSDARA